MIISKEQKIHNEILEAQRCIRNFLPTDRGSSEARIEMMKLREQSYTSGVCPYCGQQIVDRSPRRSEACMQCASKIDRLLMMKSKLLRCNMTIFRADTMQHFVEDYTSLQYVPRALKIDDMDGLLSACNNHIEAHEKMNVFKKEKERAKIAENVRKKRMQYLDTMYNRCKEQMSEEEYAELLESQYVQHFIDDIK